MVEFVEKMYRDAMVIGDIHCLQKETSLTNGERISDAWKRISEGLEDMIPRVAHNDISLAKELLRVWKEVGEGERDFRVLAARTENSILPVVRKALEVLYPPMEDTCGNWHFIKSPTGFFSVKSKNDGRFIHNPYDPMEEARTLADELYRDGMDGAVLLGSGLGYLAYQLWVRSEKLWKIVLFEDDKTLLQSAFQLGVLGWIDESALVIADNEDIDDMLKGFIQYTEDQDYIHYVNDWKSGKYNESIYGEMVDRIDFNQRTERIYGSYSLFNEKRNRIREVRCIDQLKNSLIEKSKTYVIVSAGPSLDDNISFLKKVSNNMMIIAVNTALKRLEKEKIVPDVITMLDPLPTLRRHLDNIEYFTENIPLVSILSGSSMYMDVYRGPIFLTDEEHLGNAKDYPWIFSGTVTSLALDVAFYLGADRVFLIGSDLAYPGNMNYAKGVAHGQTEYMATEEQRSMRVKSVDGGMVSTYPVYDNYRRMIERQILMHSDTTVYNLSKHGALIKGTKNWEDVKDEYSAV